MTSARRLLVLCMLVLTCSCACSSAATVEEYNRTLARVHQSLASAERMEKARPGSSHRMLRDLQHQTPKKMPVAMEDGTRIDADLSWARDGIDDILWESGKERREKIADLATRTEAAVRLNGGNAAASSVSDDKARAVLAKELSKKEYTPSLKDDLWLRAGKWIQDMLEAIFSHLPSGSWTAVAYVLAAIAIILFAIVLVFLAKMIVEHYGSRAPREMPVYRHIERTSTRPSIESLLQAADEAASGSRYREALRHIYLATLLTLDRAQLISYVEGTTNWEYMRALRRQGASQSAVFGDMTLLFDEAVYGHRDLSQQDYTSTRERLRELEATL